MLIFCIHNGRRSSRHILSIIMGFYQLRDFEQISQLLKKYQIPVDIEDSNNETDLIAVCMKNLDKEGILFCLQHGVGCDKLSHRARKSIENFDETPAETIEFADFLLSQGHIDIDIWDLFHYTLVWGYPKLHQHLLEHWKHKINPSQIVETLKMSARFGCLDSIKYILDLKEPYDLYKPFVTQEVLQECLWNVISIDCYCSGIRYNLIKYLFVEKNVLLIEKYNILIRKFLQKFSAKNLDQSEHYVFPYKDKNHPSLQQIKQWADNNHIYMPKWFKGEESP